jgi:hypothetical protein
MVLHELGGLVARDTLSANFVDTYAKIEDALPNKWFNQYDKIVVPEHVIPNNLLRKEFQYALAAEIGLPFRPLDVAFVKTLERQGLLKKYEALPHSAASESAPDPEKPVYRLNVAALVNDLDEKDLQRIMNEYWQAKHDLVEKLFDVFINESTYRSPVDASKTFKDWMYEPANPIG